MMPKLVKQKMKTSSAAELIAGSSRGRVIRQKICQGEAPRSAAASVVRVSILAQNSPTIRSTRV